MTIDHTKTGKARRRAWHNVLECELFCYHETLNQFEAALADPAALRISCPVLITMARHLTAIGRLLDHLDTTQADRAELVRRYYFAGDGEDALLRSLGIDARTFNTWRREVVELLGYRVGAFMS